MKVLLLENIVNLGKKNDIKHVKDGYGRNFLLRNKLAKILMPTDENNVILEKEKQEKNFKELKYQIELLKEKIKSLNLVLKIKVGKSNQAFGSITPLRLVNELKKLGINLEKEQILTKPIKTLGENKIKIKLHQDIETYLNILVKPENND